MEEQQRSENSFDDMEVEKLNIETNHLTSISRFFPDLVWEQVVGKLTKSSDIESCSNSSPFFRKLLQKKLLRQVLIPNVFQPLLPYLIDENHSEGNEIENEVPDPELLLPNIEGRIDNLDIQEVGNNANPEIGNAFFGDHQDEPGLLEFKDNSMKDISNCRLVSKRWNSAIEAVFPHKDTGHYMLRFDMNNFKNLELEPYSTEIFMASNPPRVFMEHFDPTHYNVEENRLIKNPFLGRSVQFMDVQIRRLQENEHVLYLNGILELLRKYGTEIWYVYFDFYNSLFNNDPVVLYQRLREFLTLLPNLKVLRIRYQDIHRNIQDMLQQDLVRKCIFDSLSEEVNRSLIPTLPNLEFMCLSNLPTPIFNELIVRNRHILQLQVDRKPYHDDYGLFWIPFTNLNILSVRMASTDQFETFENCQFPMQLGKFYLWYDDNAPFISWTRIIHALESKFAKCCSELLLQMPLPKTEQEKKKVLEESYLCRLKLKKLKRVTIFDDTPFCLDFLLGSKNTLSRVYLRYSNDHNENAAAQHLKNQQFVGCRQKVQFVGYRDKMEESNIWTELPKLVEVFLQRNSAMGGCVRYTVDSARNQRTELVKIEKEHWYSETGGIPD